MPRNGTVAGLNNLVVKQVRHDATGSTAVLQSANGVITITIQSTAGFPSDMNVRVNGQVDMRLDYDPK